MLTRNYVNSILKNTFLLSIQTSIDELII